VKGQGTDSGGGGSGSGLCHVDEPWKEPHATPHLTDATFSIRVLADETLLLLSCQQEKKVSTVSVSLR
jgi:hypothetical protein